MGLFQFPLFQRHNQASGLFILKGFYLSVLSESAVHNLLTLSQVCQSARFWRDYEQGFDRADADMLVGNVVASQC